ncbi:MAG: ABC transporter substrate-binding protein [Rhodocyclaceae bacterium]|nr:ABC transporter substrate-binding protein [Rhodocyclaceae bacterium]
MWIRKLLLAALGVAGVAGTVQAEIKVGVMYSATGPGASVGMPQQRLLPAMPTTVGGEPVRYIELDDGSDTTAAAKNAAKLTAEAGVDVIVGPSLTTSSLAVLDVIAESGTPMISMAAGAAIVEPLDAKRQWAFKTPQSDGMMAELIADHMVRSGAKRVAFIGLNDAYGEGWWKVFSKLAEARKLEVVASERYARTDTAVTGQVLKAMAANPDTVFIASFGTPAVLPQSALAERGYRGRVYQTHGIANNDYLRVGGKTVEGTLVPAGPVLVAEQLPADHPARKPGMEFVAKYEALPGAGVRSTFASYLWDAVLILDKAIPVAVKQAKPGSKEFRKALRDAIENVKDVQGANGVYGMSKTDHIGLDNRARVMVQIVDGKWKYLP